MKWRCRRGLLELDIVLRRFVDTSYERLDASQMASFEALLDLTDNDLWELVSGRQFCRSQGQLEILSMIHESSQEQL